MAPPTGGTEMLTDDENTVLTKLGEAWNAFLALPEQHADDVTEFRHALHRLQEKVLARPALRVFGK